MARVIQIQEDTPLKEESIAYDAVVDKVHRLTYTDQEMLLLELVKSVLAPNNPNLGPAKKAFLSSVLTRLQKMIGYSR